MIHVDFVNLDLEPCCREALEDIQAKLRAAQILKRVLASSPFFMALSEARMIPLAATILSYEWRMWGEALENVDGIVKRRCQDVAGLELLNHSGGSLNRFWKDLYDSFR